MVAPNHFPDLPAKMGQARINQPASELLPFGFALFGSLTRPVPQDSQFTVG